MVAGMRAPGESSPFGARAAPVPFSFRFASPLARQSSDTSQRSAEDSGSQQTEALSRRSSEGSYSESEVSAAQMMLHIRTGCVPVFRFPPQANNAFAQAIH